VERQGLSAEAGEAQRGGGETTAVGLGFGCTPGKMKRATRREGMRKREGVSGSYPLAQDIGGGAHLLARDRR
jgi:hypothetical protein